jgi:hypothetical protein
MVQMRVPHQNGVGARDIRLLQPHWRCQRGAGVVINASNNSTFPR